MGDAVSIISVSVSGVVAVGGLISAGWGASRERRWKSREERTIDLRSVLEGAGESFGVAMFATAQAWEDVANGRGLSEERKAAVDQGWLNVVNAGNRIGVRRGHSSAEHAAFRECIAKLHTLRRAVANVHVNGVSNAREKDYYRAHDEAVEAETIYVNAAAKLLGPAA